MSSLVNATCRLHLIYIIYIFAIKKHKTYVIIECKCAQTFTVQELFFSLIYNGLIIYAACLIFIFSSFFFFFFLLNNNNYLQELKMNATPIWGFIMNISNIHNFDYLHFHNHHLRHSHTTTTTKAHNKLMRENIFP